MRGDRASAGASHSAAFGTGSGEALLARRVEELYAGFAADGPGVVVGVAQRGRWLHRGAAGLANVEHRVPMTPATRLPIASVTKHFTCAVALHLERAGKLTFEDPIGRWIPELRGRQARPLLRQLMTHTGGLRCFLDLAVLNGVRTVPATHPLAAQVRQQGVNFAPGEGFLYSNGGYHLLSLALERAAGRPFGELVGEYCLLPAGLRATAAPRRPWPVEPGLATQYAACAGGWRHVPSLLDEHLGDGSMVSTVDDLFEWLRHLRAASGPVSLDVLAAPTRLANGDVSGYGLGLIAEHWRGVRLVHHGGLLLGASCLLLTVPEHGLDVFVGCNRPASLRTAALGLVEAVLGEQLRPAAPPPRAQDHATLLGRYVAAERDASAEFADVDGALALGLYGSTATPLAGYEAAPGEWPFQAPGYAGPARFAAVGAAAFDCLEVGLTRRFHRLAGPAGDATAVLEGADGCFESDEAAASLRFAAGPAGLRVYTRGEYGSCEFAATVLAPDLLQITPVDLEVAWLARLERTAGRVERVVLSSARTRHLPFTRARS